jgi:hypothetical protein
MATAAANVTTWIYGQVQGAPPYIGATPFARQDTFSTPQRMAFSVANTKFWPTSQGIRFGNYYVYSIVEVAPTGLNQQSTKFGSGDSVATLVTGSQL